MLLETHVVNNEDGTTKWFDDVVDDFVGVQSFRFLGFLRAFDTS